MPSDEEIKEIVEEAFQPLQCSAEFFDYGNKFRFRIFNPKGEGIFRVAEAPSYTVRNEWNLREMIEDARRTVEEKGYKLHPRDY